MVQMQRKIKWMVDSTRFGWTSFDHDAWHTHTQMQSRLDLSSICRYFSSGIRCPLFNYHNGRTLRNTKTKPNTAGIQQLNCWLPFLVFSLWSFDLSLNRAWTLTNYKSKTKVKPIGNAAATQFEPHQNWLNLES